MNQFLDAHETARLATYAAQATESAVGGSDAQLKHVWITATE